MPAVTCHTQRASARAVRSPHGAIRRLRGGARARIYLLVRLSIGVGELGRVGGGRLAVGADGGYEDLARVNIEEHVPPEKGAARAVAALWSSPARAGALHHASAWMAGAARRAPFGVRLEDGVGGAGNVARDGEEVE
eukprot:4007771-Prymnesium_polylepis.1